MSRSDVRRQAFMELADQWRRLAEAQARVRLADPVDADATWRTRGSRVN